MTQKKHTRQNHSGFWIGLALISVQVSWVPTANSAAATEQPAWFKTAMAKEKKRLRRGSKFVLDGDVLTGKIPGKIISRPEKSEGSWYFSSNIGTDSPLECAYYEEPLNIAQATSEVADNIVAAMVNAHGPMKSKALMAASVGHNEGRPVLALEWLYTVGKENNVQAGLAKVRSTTIGDTVLLCWHNELGYRETFERAFDSVVSSAKGVEVETPYYQSLYLQSLDDKPIGFVQMSFIEDADGDTRSTVVNASLLAVDNKTLSTTDSATVGYSTPTGSLINALASSANNGETTFNLKLDPVEGEQWRVSGEYQGKALDVPLQSGGDIISELGQVLAIAALQQTADQNEVVLNTWLPDVDPTKFIPAEIVLDAKDPSSGQMAVSGIEMSVKLDDSGNMLQGTGKLAQFEVGVELVWEQGKLPGPQK